MVEALCCRRPQQRRCRRWRRLAGEDGGPLLASGRMLAKGSLAMLVLRVRLPAATS